MRKIFQTGVRIVITIAAVAYALSLVPWSEVTSSIARASAMLIGLGVFLQLLTRIAAAERTYAVTRSLQFNVSRRRTVETLFITNFYSLLLPEVLAGGVGTVYRYREFGISWERSLGALMVSRVIEIAIFLACGCFALAADHGSPVSSSGRIPLLLGTIATAILGILVLNILTSRMRSAYAQRESLVSSSHAKHGRVQQLAAEFMRIDTPGLVKAAASAGMQVLLGAFGTVLFAAALNIELPLITAVWVMSVAYAATLLPLSIAGIGVREVTLVHVLATVGVAPAGALAISLLLLLCQLLCAAIGGVLQVRTRTV